MFELDVSHAITSCGFPVAGLMDGFGGFVCGDF